MMIFSILAQRWRGRFFVLALVFGLIACFEHSAAAQGNCPGADGNDLIPDDDALNACLATGGTILLDADVTYGYRIESGLTLSVNGTVLTATSNWGYRALLYVSNPNLSAPILNVLDGVSNYQISNIWFYGNKFDRNGRPLFVGAVQVKKNCISFHLMPLYGDRALLEGMSAHLRGRMQGKSCFNFTTIEPAQVRELSALTKRGIARFRKVKLPWE